MTTGSRERACRDASILAILPLLVLAITIFLPLEARQKPIAALLRRDPQDAVAVLYYAVPVVLSAMTAVSAARRREPGSIAFSAAGVLVLLVAGGVLFLLVVATAQAPEGRLGVRPWLTILPLAGIWMFLRAQHRDGWERWVRVLGAFGATLLAVALLLTTRLSAFDRPALGAALFLGAAGMLAPIAAWSVWPHELFAARRRARTK